MDLLDIRDEFAKMYHCSLAKFISVSLLVFACKVFPFLNLHVVGFGFGCISSIFYVPRKFAQPFVCRSIFIENPTNAGTCSRLLARQCVVALETGSSSCTTRIQSKSSSVVACGKY